MARATTRWMTPHLLLACALFASTTGCSGCFGPDDEGNSNEGYFDVRFAAEEPVEESRDPSHFNYTPVTIATGATLDVRLLDYEPPRETQHVPVEPRDVRIEPSSVAEVVSTGHGRLTLRGLEAGEATVHFRADADGDEVDDAFEIRVRDVSQLTLDHYWRCGDTYVAGYPFFTDFSLLPSDVVGAGIHPITVDPEGATRVDEEESNAYFIVYDAPQPETTSLSLRSELAPVELPPLELRFVEPSEIEGFEAVRVRGLSSMDVGDSVTMAFLPVVDGMPACSIMPVRVRSKTPEICDLHGLRDPVLWRAAQQSRAAMAVLVALAAGTCLLEIVADDLPGLSTGAAATVEVDFTIDEPPRRSSGGGDDDWDD